MVCLSFMSKRLSIEGTSNTRDEDIDISTNRPLAQIARTMMKTSTKTRKSIK